VAAIADTVHIRLDRDQIVERIDRGARERRGMSGRDLLRAYDKGQLDDPGSVADLLVLADLLDPGDSLRLPRTPIKARLRRLVGMS
jgi:hypothetical protein